MNVDSSLRKGGGFYTIFCAPPLFREGAFSLFFFLLLRFSVGFLLTDAPLFVCGHALVSHLEVIHNICNFFGVYHSGWVCQPHYCVFRQRSRKGNLRDISDLIQQHVFSHTLFYSKMKGIILILLSCLLLFHPMLLGFSLDHLISCLLGVIFSSKPDFLLWDGGWSAPEFRVFLVPGGCVLTGLWLVAVIACTVWSIFSLISSLAHLWLVFRKSEMWYAALMGSRWRYRARLACLEWPGFYCRMFWSRQRLPARENRGLSSLLVEKKY